MSGLPVRPDVPVDAVHHPRRRVTCSRRACSVAGGAFVKRLVAVVLVGFVVALYAGAVAWIGDLA